MEGESITHGSGGGKTLLGVNPVPGLRASGVRRRRVRVHGVEPLDVRRVLSVAHKGPSDEAAAGNTERMGEVEPGEDSLLAIRPRHNVLKTEDDGVLAVLLLVEEQVNVFQAREVLGSGDPIGIGPVLDLMEGRWAANQAGCVDQDSPKASLAV